MSTKELNTNDTLALKYRPKRFEEVAGHKPFVASLKGMIETQQIPNAIAFIGLTGLGKTTFSRMLARYINCATGDACGKCESCKQMDNRNHPDYHEVNAGTVGNIDTMRDIINGSMMRPRNKLRIICIDEAHRLSLAASNALLKPMEEPAERTLWIITTSEPDKIPNSGAILGRCQQFRLTSPSAEDITDRLATIAKKEKFKWFKTSVGKAIAEASGGQVRDAVQLLETSARFAAGAKAKGKELRKQLKDSVINVAVMEGDELAFEMLAAIYTGSSKKLMAAILDAGEGDAIAIINKCIWANMFLTAIAAGVTKHKKIWWTPLNKRLNTQLTKAKALPSAVDTAYVHGKLLDVKKGFFQPQADQTGLMIAGFFAIIDAFVEEE